MDPTSGTAMLLEITRAMGQMYKNGTIPCSHRNDLERHLHLSNRISTTTYSNVLFMGCGRIWTDRFNGICSGSET